MKHLGQPIFMFTDCSDVEQTATVSDIHHLCGFKLKPLCFLSVQAVCQFNSALSTIRHDVALLVRSAAVGFDSLPREMAAVLEAVWSGKMPVKWSQGVCSEALSLKDGMTGTLDHDEQLAPIFYKTRN